MSRLENPFKLTPATAAQFVGRSDILQRWQERLTPDSDAWNSAQSWLITGSGGVGKTSLLNKMTQVAQDDFKAHVVYLDLGHYRQLDREEDFFHYLDTHLPPAQRWSSRLRRWFDLPADASTGQVTTQFFSLLSNFAVAFSHVNWGGLGFEFSPPGTDSKRPSGFSQRLIQAFNTLAILSEEQERPVVLLIDQVGKIHDAYRWLLVGYQFLRLAERIHRYQTPNIICVFSLRPERKGLLEYELEYYLRTPLFKNDVHHIEHLHPFRRQEAMTAVYERAKGQIGWNQSIAGKIARALNASAGVDPYHVILGASAVWEHLYSGEEKMHPGELDDTAVHDIVRQGHGYLLESVRRRSATQWAVLSLLSFYPAGLTVDAITEQLNLRYKNLSLQEVEQAVATLSDQAGYRLLDTIPNVLPVQYILAHDILREHLQQQLPAEERIREQVQKLLDDGTWGYANNFSTFPFHQQNLALLWQHHAQLSFSSTSWKAIVDSELIVDETRLLLWGIQYPEEIKHALAQLDKTRTESLSDFRYHMITAYIDPTSKRLAGILRELVQNAGDEQVRQQAIGALGQLGEPALSMLSKLAQNDKDGQARQQAIGALGQLGEPALPLLSELALNDRDGQVRQQVVNALAQIGAPALSVLIESAQNDKDESVRGQAAKALAQIGEPALSVLIELAQNDKAEWVRWLAAYGLGQLGEQDMVLSVLSELALNAAEQSVRGWATRALGRLGEPALPVLSQLAQNDKDKSMHGWATRALGQIGEPALSVLSQLALNAKDESVRRLAVEALAQIGAPALSTLRELALNDKDRWVRFQAVRALGQIGEPGLTVLSQLALNDKDESVRRLAAEALAQIGAPGIPILSKVALNDKDTSVRRQTAETLGQLGERDIALSVLAELIQNDKDSSVRRQAAETLGQLGEPALSVLSEVALNDKDESVRKKAAETLGQFDQRDIALSVLSELAQNAADKSMRRQAAQALGQLGEPALSVLGEVALNDEDESMRKQAAQALGQIGEPALPVLSEVALHDKDESMRKLVTQALGQIGEPALSVLSEVALNDNDESVRRLVAKALGQIGEPALPALFNISWQGIGNQSAEVAALNLVTILKTQIDD